MVISYYLLKESDLNSEGMQSLPVDPSLTNTRYYEQAIIIIDS